MTQMQEQYNRAAILQFIKYLNDLDEVQGVRLQARIHDFAELDEAVINFYQEALQLHQGDFEQAAKYIDKWKNAADRGFFNSL